MKFEWELIDDASNEYWNCSFRAKVHGGWIVRHFHQLSDDDALTPSSSMVFVPDIYHDWRIEK